jgi:hypothetical protein
MQVIETHTVYSDGHHNAWTDLALFQDRWYAFFKSGWWHSGPGHRPVYARSTDLAATEWETPRGIAPLDDLQLMGSGPAKFFVWRDQLWAVVHMAMPTDPNVATPPGRAAKSQAFVMHSPDGMLWSEPKPVLERGQFMWRVQVQHGELYAAVFEITYERNRDIWLLRSDDMFRWAEVARWYGSQPDLLFDENGEAVSHGLSARESGNFRNLDTLRRSRPPYTEWHTEELGFIVHSPVLARAGGKLLMAGVEWLSEPGRQTTLRAYENGRFGEPLVLYPDGDCGYPGMIAVPDREDEVLVSYYGGVDRPGLGFRPVTVRREVNGESLSGYTDAAEYYFAQRCDIFVSRVRVT